MTVQEVFDRAINLLDEQNETTGETVTADTGEYKLRTVRLTNTISARLFPYTGLPVGETEKPAVFPDLTSMTDTVWLDEYLCGGVLPYYLASELIRPEDEELAVWMKREGDEALASLRSRAYPAEEESITDAYGGIEHGEYARWDGYEV